MGTKSHGIDDNYRVMINATHVYRHKFWYIKRQQYFFPTRPPPLLSVLISYKARKNKRFASSLVTKTH